MTAELVAINRTVIDNMCKENEDEIAKLKAVGKDMETSYDYDAGNFCLMNI